MISKGKQKLIRQLGQKKFRTAEGLFVAEGPKVVGDLLRAGFEAEDLFGNTDFLGTISQGDKQMKIHNQSPCTDEEIAKVSFLQHPQGVIAIFRIPTEQQPTIGDNTLTLMLDGVQDPGNLGTILRIADWFDIRQIVCSPDTADAFSPKVVQATMGSIAHVAISYQTLLPFLESLPASYPVYGTLLDGDNIYQQQLSQHGIIIMGNEGNGISQLVRQKITRKLLIPSFGANGAESLNVAVATAITCSEFRRVQSS